MRNTDRMPWFLLLLGSALLATGCAKHQRPVDDGIRTGTLLVGNQNEPATLDPQLLNAYTDMRVAIALFEGLTSLDEKTAQPVPAVAERWEISPDGLTYTFHLRPDAKWSDGESVTAEDFAYSFQRILTPSLGSLVAYYLFPIKNAEAFHTRKLTDFSQVGVAVIDHRTLKITLERPTPYLLALIAHNSWLPVSRRVVEKFGAMDARDSAWTRPGNLVGNGAFMLTEWRPNSRIVVKKNPHYWGAAHNKIASVVFSPIEKADAEELSYRAGQLHITFSLPSSKIATYRAHSPANLRIAPFLQTGYVSFNVTKPPLDNPKVRRALALAIDREAVSARIYESARTPAPTLVPNGCGGYQAPTGQRQDYAAARALLEAAGFPGGRGLPAMSLEVGNDEKLPKFAEILQATWLRELGVQVSIAMIEQKTLMQNQQTLAYTIGIMGWVADYPDPVTFLEILQTGNTNNWTGWSSKTYDALMQEAATTLDPQQRLATLRRAEEHMLEQAPIAPVIFGASTYLLHSAVQNWQPSPVGLNRYQLLELRN